MKTPYQVLEELWTPLASQLLPHDAADKTIQALTDAGYVIVPVEPTDEMEDAGDDSFDWDSSDINGSSFIQHADAGKCWRAMITASQRK